MNIKSFISLLFASALSLSCFAQTWNGKKCAVVLTYDDALDGHLDRVVPALDSLHLKATFYLIAGSPVVSKRLAEWRKAAKTGHELGNHSLNHPCDGSLPGRDFVTPEGDLSRYTLSRTLNEIRVANTLLKAIDGKEKRTFAYPCGDLKVEGTLFFPSLQQEFVAARGVYTDYVKLKGADLTNLPAFAEANSSGETMVAQVKKAEETGSCIVFLFHGVGGGHSLNVALNEHKKLIKYLSDHRKDIWVAPMVNVAEFIAAQKQKESN